MARLLIEESLLFFIPFALFLAWLVIRRRNPFLREVWAGASYWLILSALVLGIGGLIYTGLTQEPSKGQFIPTHTENGVVVPGQFR